MYSKSADAYVKRGRIFFEFFEIGLSRWHADKHRRSCKPIVVGRHSLVNG